MKRNSIIEINQRDIDCCSGGDCVNFGECAMNAYDYATGRIGAFLAGGLIVLAYQYVKNRYINTPSPDNKSK